MYYLLSRGSKLAGTTVSFSYDADGNRISKTVTSGGTTTTTVKDVYQLGLVAYETDGAGTLLATFTYDSEGVPVSVQVGADPATAPRYYYVYNGHGDVVALVDAAGATVASYAYDTFGGITSSSESFANGWVNPYRYDGRDRVRYDAETGLYWMSVRAYDPTIGRFLSRDPLGQAPLFFADQPYVYAGNNPLVNVDPSGQLYWTGIPGGCAKGSSQSCGGSGSNPVLDWIAGQLQQAGLNTTIFGIGLAFRQRNAASAVGYFRGVVGTLGKHHHFAKDPGRYARRTADLGEAQGWEDTLAKFGKVLIGVGFVLDLVGFAITYFNSGYRHDLTGVARILVAIVAGLIHAFIVTLAAVGGPALVGVFLGPLGFVAASLLGGIFGFAAGKIADWTVPRLIDIIVPHAPSVVRA